MIESCGYDRIDIHIAAKEPVFDHCQRVGQSGHFPAMLHDVLTDSVALQPPALNPADFTDVGIKMALQSRHGVLRSPVAIDLSNMTSQRP